MARERFMQPDPLPDPLKPKKTVKAQPKRIQEEEPFMFPGVSTAEQLLSRIESSKPLYREIVLRGKPLVIEMASGMDKEKKEVKYLWMMKVEADPKTGKNKISSIERFETAKPDSEYQPVSRDELLSSFTLPQLKEAYRTSFVIYLLSGSKDASKQ